MKNKTNNTLEFANVLEQLASLALSEKAKEKLLALQPVMSEAACRAKMQETTEAKNIMESLGSPPLTSMKELDKILNLSEKGSMLIAEQITSVANLSHPASA